MTSIVEEGNFRLKSLAAKSDAAILFPIMVVPMRPERRAPRYPFAATAEAIDSSDVRPASVKDLSIFGAYLAMPNPFSKGAVVLVKIHSKTEFFQCNATVVHATGGLGMGIEFSNMNQPFRTVLQEWLLRLSMSPLQESPKSTIGSK